MHIMLQLTLNFD